jgi:hypothetical protein
MREHADNWDELLPFVSMAINSTVHESTGYSPFFLIHGMEMQQPIDLVVPLPSAPTDTPDSYADELLTKMDAAYESARLASLRQAQRSKRRYDLAARMTTYRVGDSVYWLKHTNAPGEHPKFRPLWSGPWTVTAILSDVNVMIQEDATGQSKPAHIDRLCHKPTDPDAPPDDSDDEPVDVDPPPDDVPLPPALDERDEADDADLFSLRNAAPLSADDLLLQAAPPPLPAIAPSALDRAAPARPRPPPRTSLPRTCKARAAASSPDAAVRAPAPGPAAAGQPLDADPAMLPSLIRRRPRTATPPPAPALPSLDGPLRTYDDAGLVPLRPHRASATEPQPAPALGGAPSGLLPAVMRRPASRPGPAAAGTAQIHFVRTISAEAVRARLYAVHCAREADLRAGRASQHTYNLASGPPTRPNRDSACQTDPVPALAPLTAAHRQLAPHPCQRLPDLLRLRRSRLIDNRTAHRSRRSLRQAARLCTRLPRTLLGGEGEGLFD